MALSRWRSNGVRTLSVEIGRADRMAFEDSGSAFWLRLIGGTIALAVERRSNPVGRNWSGRQDALRGLRLRFLALLD